MNIATPYIVETEGKIRVAEIDPKAVPVWSAWRQSSRLHGVRTALDEVLAEAGQTPGALVGQTKRELKRTLGEDFGRVTETLTIVSILELADGVGFNPRMMLQDMFQALHEHIEGDFSRTCNEVAAFINLLERRLYALEDPEGFAHAHLTPEHVLALYENRVLHKGDFSRIADLLDHFGIDFLPYSTREALPEGVSASYKNIPAMVDQDVFETILYYMQTDYLEEEHDVSWEDCLRDVLSVVTAQVESVLRTHGMEDWQDAQETVVSDAVNQLLWAQYIFREDPSKTYHMAVYRLGVTFLRHLWKRIINEKYPQYR